MGGGRNLWLKKVQLLIEASEVNNENPDRVEIFSDVDISIYRSPIEQTLYLMKNYDILFQREWGRGSQQVNIGFIALKKNNAVKYFWQAVYERVEKDDIWDQKAVNDLLEDETIIKQLGLKVGRFPETFWALSIGNLPEGDCVLHHANCATSMVHKWLQLNVYRPLFESSPDRTKAAFQTICQYLFDRVWTVGEMNRRSALGQIKISSDLTVSCIKGKMDFSMLIKDNVIIIRGEGEKIKCILDDFYIDRQRSRMLCVGNCCPENYLSSPLKINFFYMYADI
ncbi:hypothetical protein AA18890_1643 [Komagataeibacter europaeus LMG 18890]|nr:hypothetical protein AA18890_1643 [Komagataeibacter europaeus LMG 18890]